MANIEISTPAQMAIQSLNSDDTRRIQRLMPHLAEFPQSPFLQHRGIYQLASHTSDKKYVTRLSQRLRVIFEYRHDQDRVVILDVFPHERLQSMYASATQR